MGRGPPAVLKDSAHGGERAESAGVPVGQAPVRKLRFVAVLGSRNTGGFACLCVNKRPIPALQGSFAVSYQ